MKTGNVTCAYINLDKLKNAIGCLRLKRERAIRGSYHTLDGYTFFEGGWFRDDIEIVDPKITDELWAKLYNRQQFDRGKS